MNKFPGNVLIESPKVDFITILDTHGAIPWRDSMDLGHSMNKFPGNFLIESKFDRVILSINFQICFFIEPATNKKKCCWNWGRFGEILRVW